MKSSETKPEEVRDFLRALGIENPNTRMISVITRKELKGDSFHNMRRVLLWKYPQADLRQALKLTLSRVTQENSESYLQAIRLAERAFHGSRKIDGVLRKIEKQMPPLITRCYGV